MRTNLARDEHGCAARSAVVAASGAVLEIAFKRHVQHEPVGDVSEGNWRGYSKDGYRAVGRAHRVGGHELVAACIRVGGFGNAQRLCGGASEGDIVFVPLQSDRGRAFGAACETRGLAYDNRERRRLLLKYGFGYSAIHSCDVLGEQLILREGPLVDGDFVDDPIEHLLGEDTVGYP